MVLGYSVHPGNENDGKTFPSVYEKINHLDIEVVVGDTAYKTPAIAHKLKEDGIALLSTYSCPKTKDGFFRKYEYVYEETIERIFGLAKELHGFRYTQQFGKAQMEVKAALTFACMNLKKLVKKRWKTDRGSLPLLRLLDFFGNFFNIHTTNPLPAYA